MQLYSGARGQIFGLPCLHLVLYYVCPSREGSDKTAQVHWKIAGFIEVGISIFFFTL